jgi:hypothetical protein
MGAKDQKKISKKKMLIGKRPDTFTIYKVTIEEGVQYKDAAYICYIQRCCIHLLYTKMLHTFAIYKVTVEDGVLDSAGQCTQGLGFRVWGLGFRFRV